jgi:hypothetical protein
MGDSKAYSVPLGAAHREMQQMWLSLMHGSWSSIAVVPTDPGLSAKVVIGALLDAARQDDVGRFDVIDAEGASAAHGERLAQELASVVARGARAIVAVDSLMQSLGGTPLVRDADAVLLVVRLGVSNFDSVQSTIDIVGRERILGAVTLP